MHHCAHAVTCAPDMSCGALRGLNVHHTWHGKLALPSQQARSLSLGGMMKCRAFLFSGQGKKLMLHASYPPCLFSSLGVDSCLLVLYLPLSFHIFFLSYSVSEGSYAEATLLIIGNSSFFFSFIPFGTTFLEPSLSLTFGSYRLKYLVDSLVLFVWCSRYIRYYLPQATLSLLLRD